ncbi:ankyrin repeat-containing domain protein [Triangularia verruculosa]|uniref:Ankyrin repeat-containing domain protein n=1 Tax=Triangularia verruculosa TaxID=2587418 RepID=A0AAN6XMU7_9PEZI|nr:ankyrin repeat-containing domain protein [Triangularia verruculosa]
MADPMAPRPAKRRRKNGKADRQKNYLAQVPNEILLMIAEAGHRDYTLDSLRTIACLARTCRGFHHFLNPILYRYGTKRHPYLLHWASYVGNTRTAELAIVSGARVSAFFLPDRSFGYAPGAHYFSGLMRDPYRQIHNSPYKIFRGKRSPNPKHKRLTVFRNCYRVSDIAVQDAGSRLNPKLTLTEFCHNVQPEAAAYIELFRVSDGMHSLTQGNWSHVTSPKYSCSTAPIHLAAIGGHLDILSLLLAHGADINAPSHYLCNCALRHEHSAIRVSPSHLVRSIFKPEAYGDAIRRDVFPWTWTALHLALCRGQEDAFWYLFNKGVRNLFATLCGSEFIYSDLLHHAIALQQWPIANKLVDSHGYSAEISKKDALGVTPIWVAYYDNKMDVVRELIQYGACIDEDLGQGFTPLIHACMFGRWGQAMDLINLGASVDTQFNDYHCEDTYRYEHENVRVLQGAMFRPLDLVVARWPNRLSSGIWYEEIAGRYKPALPNLRDQQEMDLVDLLLKKKTTLSSRPDEHDDGEYSVPRSIDTVCNAAREHQVRHLGRIIRSNQFKNYYKRHQGYQRVLRAMLSPSHCPDVSREPESDRHKWTESWATGNAKIHYCRCFRILHNHLVRHGYPGFMEEE